MAKQKGNALGEYGERTQTCPKSCLDALSESSSRHITLELQPRHNMLAAAAPLPSTPPKSHCTHLKKSDASRLLLSPNLSRHLRARLQPPLQTRTESARQPVAQRDQRHLLGLCHIYILPDMPSCPLLSHTRSLSTHNSVSSSTLWVLRTRAPSIWNRRK